MVTQDFREGANPRCEVALVPHGSPVSQTGILYYNTLFDENAASHVALGKCYQGCLAGGGSLSNDDVSAQGGNDSMTHVDFMIGSDQADVDGIRPDGQAEPVMRAGEWVD